jgi:hypothetical protein
MVKYALCTLEVEVYIDKLSKREFTERVLFNKELFEKILNTKKTFEYIRKGTMNFFIVPLYFLVFLVFRLNFVNYEEEIFHIISVLCVLVYWKVCSNRFCQDRASCYVEKLAEGDSMAKSRHSWA